MTCPQCETHNAEPIERWTISGRKLTVPLVRMWACLNRECRHQWPRDFLSPIEALASPTCPDLPTPEVTYDSYKGSLSLSPSILDGNGH